MFKFGKTSSERLVTCSYDLQILFRTVIIHRDCSILCGHRNEFDQNVAYKNGDSNLIFPYSKHNAIPSLAVDVAPYPIDWQDLHRFCEFAGYVNCIADQMRIKIRWGGDWDGDTATTDQKLMDFVHFELVN